MTFLKVKCSGAAELGGSGLEMLMSLQLRCWPGLPSSGGLTGAGRSTSRVAHSCSWQVNAGYQQET